VPDSLTPQDQLMQQDDDLGEEGEVVTIGCRTD
jgi:hypothetical protein